MINDDFSTFKTHSAWFAQRGSQTLHDVHAGELEDFWRRRESSSPAKRPNWESGGRKYRIELLGFGVQTADDALQLGKLFHQLGGERKSTRLNSSHLGSSYALF